MTLPTVQHWLVCRRGRVEPPVGPHNGYTLRGVRYRFRVPAQMGLSPLEPLPARRLTLFARFFGGSGPTEFEIEVRWLDEPSGLTPPVVYGPYTVHFRPTEPTRDYVFVLRNLPLFGVGRYAVELIPLAAAGREPLASEFFEVVQP